MSDQYNHDKELNTRLSKQDQKYHTEQVSDTGYGSDGCFPKGTMIMTGKGHIDIFDIEAGAMVLSFDHKTKRFAPRKVLKKIAYGHRNIWCIRLNGADDIDTTASHSFLRSDGKWVKSADVSAGDKLFIRHETGDMKIVEVQESYATECREPVFNLIVEKDFNFIANGSVAHCFTHFRKLRVFLWGTMIAFKNGFGFKKRLLIGCGTALPCR